MRQGVRHGWDAVPDGVFDALAVRLGGRLTPRSLAAGGFSPGPAGPCDVHGRGQVFVKACSASLNTVTPTLLRREAEVLGVLPSGVPAPRLLALVDDGDWVALAIEHLDGRTPMAPLRPADAQTFLELVEAIATFRPEPRSLPPAGEAERDVLWAWRRLADDATGLADRLDPWSARHLHRLVELERDWSDAVVGDALVHGDLRIDNSVLTAGGAVAVDWPSAAIGAPWFDLVAMLPSFHLDGAPPPAEVFGAHPVGAAAPSDAVDVFLAAIAGYFTRQSLLPAPPNMPTVRAFQAAQGEVARAWLAARTGWV